MTTYSPHVKKILFREMTRYNHYLLILMLANYKIILLGKHTPLISLNHV